MFPNTFISVTLFGSLFGRFQRSSDVTTCLLQKSQVYSSQRFVLKLAECIALFVVLIVLSLVIFFNLVYSLSCTVLS